MLERDLVRILGKKDEPGRPLLYGTTSNFLAFFGLKSLRDLPTLREFTELSEDSRRLAEAELGETPSSPEADAGSLATTIKPPADGGEHDTVVPSPPTDPEEEAEGN
jgi:segregation and condensation protein B